MPEQQTYMVSGYEPQGGDGIVVFTFVPQGGQRGSASGAITNRVPQFIVSVRDTDGDLDFDWRGSPDDPGEARTEIQDEIRVRMQERAVWIARVCDLVTEVDQWAETLGWSTRRVEKKLDDARVGSHRVPALVMQADTVRIMLEPIGRSSPGAEGIVDLYLMPGYDDIASIYYYGGRWNLHYTFGHGPVASIREAEAIPLSRESLEGVLAEMRQHAV